MKRLLGLCVCIAAIFGTAGVAQATCYSSLPATANFVDDPADGHGAPEITSVWATVDGNCTLTVNPGIADLDDGNAVYIYIDRDGNPATGSAALGGADEVVVTNGGRDGNGAPVLGLWDGQVFWYGSIPLGTAPAPGAFTASLDRLLITPGATISIRVVAVADRDDNGPADLAPALGAAPLSLLVYYDTTPRPPTFVPPSGPVGGNPEVTPKAPTAAPVATVAGCTVPNVKGKSRNAAEKLLLRAHCAVALSAAGHTSKTVRKGMVIDSTPGKGAKTAKRVKLLISTGKPKQHR